MSQLTQEERLALVVRAEVAVIRAGQARDRAALVHKRVQPLREGVDRFEELFGRRPDPKVPGDLVTLLTLSGDSAGKVSKEQLAASARALREVSRADLEASDALQAVEDALVPGMTTLEWVGVDAETYERAVEQALEA